MTHSPPPSDTPPAHPAAPAEHLADMLAEVTEWSGRSEDAAGGRPASLWSAALTQHTTRAHPGADRRRTLTSALQRLLAPRRNGRALVGRFMSRPVVGFAAAVLGLGAFAIGFSSIAGSVQSGAGPAVAHRAVEGGMDLYNKRPTPVRYGEVSAGELVHYDFNADLQPPAGNPVARREVEVAGDIAGFLEANRREPISVGYTAGQPPASEKRAGVSPGQGDGTTADRQVIRKATIELKGADVRAIFAKSALLISEAQGEFIEQSSLTGVDAALQGTITLRISARRLSTVLAALRELGVVTAETAGGEDVTEAAIDLEARLSNERRIEQELLGLLDTRKDSPLKDVLELRDHVGRVRQNIEKLTAQRERLGKLVSLATVLVIIRPENAPAPLAELSIGDRFTTTMSAAWSTGVRRLVEVCGAVVYGAVAGLPWWIGLFVLVLAGRWAWRRTGLNPANEPAPTASAKAG